MPSATNITPEDRFMGLFIGRSGSGKSAAAFSFPHPIKVLDLDGRIRGGLTSWINREGMDYESYPRKFNKNMPESIFQKLNSDLESIYVQAQVGQCPYKTLVLDSITAETINFLLDAIPLTHAQNKGRSLGPLALAGPEDYKFQSTGTMQVLAFLRSLPIPNIVVTAHVVNRWGKPLGADPNAIVENVILGEQLSLTDKLAENIPTYFDHIFKFEKYDSGSRVSHRVQFQGELARSAYPELGYGWADITNQDFYKLMMSRVKPGVLKNTVETVGITK